MNLGSVLNPLRVGDPPLEYNTSKPKDLDDVPPNALLEFQQATPIDAYSLTAILPVTPETLSVLDEILLPFLVPSTYIREVLVVCSESIAPQARHKLRSIVAASSSKHPDMSLRPLAGEFDVNASILRAASQIFTNWVLFLDPWGFQHIDNDTQWLLLRPVAVSAPIGPRGIFVSPNNISCIVPSGNPQVASYLHPPFVMPSKFAHKNEWGSGYETWAELGQRVSQSRLDAVGGLTVGSYRSAQLDWCPNPRRQQDTHGKVLGLLGLEDQPSYSNVSDPCLLGSTQPNEKSPFGVFAFFLPTLYDLEALAPLACRLQDIGHHIRVLIYDESGGSGDFGREERTILVLQNCLLTYDILLGIPPDLRHRELMISGWLETFDLRPDVVVEPGEEVISKEAWTPIRKEENPLYGAVSVRIPKADFPYCEWMGSLTLTEWQSPEYLPPTTISSLTLPLDWDIPHIDISIITKDRPRSLARLLSSLSSARFFGDTLDLRVHLEQSSDAETMQMVQNLQWPHGSLFVHHRIIHGGLLPAVVESWYPHSNDTYGLLLEDDVELSPLFYAWVKMTVLRYR